MKSATKRNFEASRGERTESNAEQFRVSGFKFLVIELGAKNCEIFQLNAADFLYQVFIFLNESVSLRLNRSVLRRPECSYAL